MKKNYNSDERSQTINGEIVHFHREETQYFHGISSSQIDL
jgi:hypothetical protein